jgi:hypothetical protein
VAPRQRLAGPDRRRSPSQRRRLNEFRTDFILK